MMLLNNMLLTMKDGGGFKNYKDNKKIINLAKRVEEQSNVYKKQLSKCGSSLTTSKYIIF